MVDAEEVMGTCSGPCRDATLMSLGSGMNRARDVG